MKSFNSLLFLALAGLSSVVSAKTIEMDVNGLVCAFCAQGIAKTLKGFPATDGVFVSLEHRLVAVHVKDGQDIGDATLRKAITDAGYKLVAIRRTDEPLAAIKARVAKQKALPRSKGHDHAAGEAMDMGHGKMKDEAHDE
jgi:mercuric ion binding protein